MAGPKPASRVTAEVKSDLRFIDATNVVAQHPSAGVALVGATDMRHIEKGRLTAAQVAAPRMVGERANAMVAVTAGIHNLVGAYGLEVKSMRRTVPFAYDGLVVGSLISAAVELDKGRAGESLPEIDLVSAEQLERFTGAYHVESPQTHKLRAALSSVATEFMRPDGPAQDPIDEYADNLMSVSSKYAGQGPNPAKFAELDEIRAKLGDDLSEITQRAIVESDAGLNIHQTAVLTHNILRATPADAVLGHYMGAPPA
jgi:hypothetical protein